jgi:hypothetical protein
VHRIGLQVQGWLHLIEMTDIHESSPVSPPGNENLHPSDGRIACLVSRETSRKGSCQNARIRVVQHCPPLIHPSAIHAME